MTIYSWNMLFKNADLDAALSFVVDSDADIFCIQEAPEEFVARLKSLSSYHVEAAPEVSRRYAGVRSTQYVVIVSKWPIASHGVIALPYRERMVPPRTMFFLRFMVALKVWAMGEGNRHSIFADVQTPSGLARVFNLHLPLATPAWRAEEFEMAMLERNADTPTIVCGDFNILEKLHITPLTWILGGTLADVLFFRRERRDIETRFVRHALTNALRGKLTHPLSRSQLDHILVSPHFKVQHARVIKRGMGSDHYPVTAEVAATAHTKT